MYHKRRSFNDKWGQTDFNKTISVDCDPEWAKS